MMRTVLELPGDVHEALWEHLLAEEADAEEAAFVFAPYEVDSGTGIFRCVEWFPVPPEGFMSRSPFHFELSDRTRAAVIKRAHDLNASLVEFHSHTGPWPAKFSPSDWAGFIEFVPHVWWRLKGRPYAAVVVATASFDGLVWRTRPDTPVRLDGILVDGLLVEPTRLSRLEREAYDEESF
jgi:hypothetical protein